jgi:hypothetical protein
MNNELHSCSTGGAKALRVSEEYRYSLLDL